MSKRALELFILACLFSCVFNPTPSYAEDGESLFVSLQCGSCHKTDRKAVGASLEVIAKAYGSREPLVKYLKGEAEPFVEPGKAAMMKGQLKKIAPLSDDQKTALADYILEFAE